MTNTDGEYDLGLTFLTHGQYAQDEIALADRVQPSLETLAEETNEIVWYIVEERGKAVYAAKAAGTDAIQPYASIGTRSDLHTIAGGKAILAHLSDERVERTVDERGLEAHTERTITTRGELEEMRARVRDQGYALNWGENIEGWCAVASPVVGERLSGAVAVAGPKNRLRGEYSETTLPELTSGTANELQLQLRSSAIE